MIHLGDSLEVLKTLKSESVDALVTDPPAGIGFMGKEWDGDKGGRIHWVAWMADVMRECMRVLKPGAHGLVWALPRTSHWTACALEEAGFEIRDCIYHVFGTGFPKSLDVSKAIDKAAGAEREVIGTKDIGPDIRGDNFKRDSGERMIANITAPATDAAKQWQGWGTALKPAVEVWWLVRKPLSEKTVAANVLRWGTGALNIDASRIESKSDYHDLKVTQGGSKINGNGYGNPDYKGRKDRQVIFAPSTGRFPSHLVLSHDPECIDGQCTLFCAVKALNEQSGPCKTGALTGQPRVENKLYGKAGATLGNPRFYQPDAATGASRFFYCAKTSPSERGKDNKHPTVKAQKLMRYLCKLITPPCGVILDPFMGSGSTGLAAKSEGFEFIGIELNPEYVEIAKRRIYGR